MTRQRSTACALLLVGALFGAALVALLNGARIPQAYGQQDKKTPDLAALAAEIETIKGKLPDQAHAMQDVGYHYSNLWFAGQKEHWELANFYWLEVRSHLRWAVRIIPIRKDNAGREIDLGAILQAFENTPLKQLEDAIKAKDKTKFDDAYRFTLETCYACHKASDKPFIRLQMPTQPETPIINFDPKADWPR
ncbi:MAG: hypothetical protein WD894_00130 [Pirellulales bacterium]